VIASVLTWLNVDEPLGGVRTRLLRAFPLRGSLRASSVVQWFVKGRSEKHVEATPAEAKSMSEYSPREKVLIVEVGERVCAMPLANVIETMRPLPLEEISGAPSSVRGVAVIRGIPTPVVDLGAILGTTSRATAERFVTVRAGDRSVALLVDAVLGIRELDGLAALRQLPPLLQGASNDVVQTIGTLDGQFLSVLRSSWALPNEVWEAIAPQEAIS